MDISNTTINVTLEDTTEHYVCTISSANMSRANSSHTIGYYVTGPVLTVIIVFGVIGNGLSAKALRASHGRAPAINSYLLVLALWDTTLVIASFFLYNISVLAYGHVIVYGSYVRAYPFLFVLTNSAHKASIWCVVMLAFERYYALVYPLQHRAGDHAWRIRLTLITLSVLSVLVSLPKYFEVQIVDCWDWDTGLQVPTVDSSRLRRDPMYSLIYIVIGGLLLHSLTPFLALTVLTVRVVVELRRGVQLRRRISARRSCNRASTKSNISCSSITSKRKELEKNGAQNLPADQPLQHSRSKSNLAEKGVEILPLAVMVKFMICHVMPTVLDIWERLSTNNNAEHFDEPIVNVLVDVSIALVVLNSSINFCLYAACSRQFRKKLGAIFSCYHDGEALESRRSNAYSMTKNGTTSGVEETLLSRTYSKSQSSR